MGDSFQYGDIIFLGLIAVFIALRLRSMLGKNSGIDPRTLWKQANVVATPENPLFAVRVAKKPASDVLVPEALRNNTVVSEGLKAIRAADSAFSTDEFISGAKLAFEWVVQAFSKGDKEKLCSMLSAESLDHFVNEIDAASQKGINRQSTLVAILSADITDAALHESRAQITVQFTSEQIHVTRDKEGNVIEGNLSDIAKVIDLWTFERDTLSRDPNWKIIAT